MSKRAFIVAVLVAASIAPTNALAEPSTEVASQTSAQPASLQPIIAEAAARYGLPERWIVEVIRAESNGDVRAVSRAGAQGLMQIMPATWREIGTKIPLGNDPFDVSDNVMAGAFYLRQLYDRFGFPGCLAAYNAGPGRYLDYVNGRRSLPRETISYVRIVTSRLGRPAVSLQAGQEPSNRPRSVSPTASGLFVRASNAAKEQADGQAENISPASSLQDDSLFVRGLNDGSNQ